MRVGFYFRYYKYIDIFALEQGICFGSNVSMELPVLLKEATRC
jgi:hypothetical protein